MARKKKEPAKTEPKTEKKATKNDTNDISDWQDRIRRSVKKRKEWAEQFQVELARSYFDGKQNPGYPNSEWITINKIYSHLMAQLPTLYGMDPYFYVKLKKSFNPDPVEIANYDRRGKIRQSYLNYLKTELKLKEKARMGIQDAHFSYGIMKVRYAADEVENPDAGKPMQDDQENDIQGENGEPLLEPDKIPINERYVLSRVDSDDFIFDEDAGPLEESWKFLAEKIRITKEEAEKDIRINSAVLKKLKAKTLEESRKESQTPRVGDDTKSKDADIYVMWEVYDLLRNEWFIIPEDEDFYVKEPGKLADGVEKHPYAILRFTLRDKSAYPIPPVSQAMDPQREYCLARSRIMTHRKRFNRKYEINVQGLESENEISKLESGDDGTIIRKNVSQQLVIPINDAPLDQQNYLELNHLNNDIVEIFGTPDQSRGIASADSATEADILDKRMEIREGDKMTMVIEWITTIAEKLDQLIQENITRDEAVRIVGPEGEHWQLVKAADYEEIQGEYEYSVNVGSTIPRLPQTERASWMAFLQLLAAFPQLMTQKRIMKRMAEMHHIEDEAMIDEFFQMGQKIMSGQMPMPGATQNQPGQMDPKALLGGLLGGALGGNVGGAAAQGGMMGGG